MNSADQNIDQDLRILHGSKTPTTLTPVRFPDSPRVIFTKNPLVEVICQVRFGRLLRIDSELPVAFQEALRADYPELRETKSARLPEPLAGVVGIQPNTVTTTFEFLDREAIWKVGLTSTFLALSTMQYTRWEHFKRRLKLALDTLTAVYGVSRYTRVGLRYRDLISRSHVGMKDARWTELIRPELLGELANEEFERALKHASRQLVLSLDYPGALVRLSHGLVEVEDDRGNVEDCYLVDADFHTERETERADAEECLDRFNEESGRLFRWCITRSLHDALGPMDPKPVD